MIFCHLSCINSDDSDKEKESLKVSIDQKSKELELAKREVELMRVKDSMRNVKESSEEIELADLYDDVKGSVYLIYTTDNVKVSQGSAFVINSKGDAISNYHVFKNASEAVAINHAGQKYMIDRIYEYDEENDYIVFRIGPNYEGMKYAKLASEISRTGDQCFAIGNPEGLTQTLSTGIISSYRSGGRIIQTTTEITHGSSGGPLFNLKGEVIGITTSGIGEANLNFAINIDRLPLGKYFSKNANHTFNELQTLNAGDRVRVVELLNKYHSAILAGDFNATISCLSENLLRFYRQFNIASKEAITEDFNYKNRRGIVPREIRVDWNSLKLESSNENIVGSFNMEYIIQRDDVNKASKFDLKIYFEIDSDFKISSIYEDILSKY